MHDRDFMVPGKSVALAENGMAATSHPQATLAAIEILKAGGTAVDAAIAAVALQGVIDPHMTGIGGDCFALYAPASGPMVSYNGSGRSPRAATLDTYLEKGWTTIPDDSVHTVTVPGAVDTWCRLNREHGKLGLDRVLAPAIEAAENGFTIPPRVAHDWQLYASRVAAHADAAAQFLPGGRSPVTGDRLSNPALGATLRRIAREGRSAFYEGEVADDMVATLRALGGLHDAGDFASFACEETQPISRRLSRPPARRVSAQRPGPGGADHGPAARRLRPLRRVAERDRPHPPAGRGHQGGLPAARRAGRRSGRHDGQRRGGAVRRQHRKDARPHLARPGLADRGCPTCRSTATPSMSASSIATAMRCR